MNDRPAILGGSPVRPQGPPDWPMPDPEVERVVADALRDGSWGRYESGHVEKLEAELARYHEIPFALTCASGTLAVEIALRSLPVGSGDEVIVAGYDYESNLLCVHAVGATPVLVDVAANNWNFDPNRIANAFGPKTKAILVSHLHGGLVPMAEVTAMAAAHGLRVIEDAAQATGAAIHGRKAGTWGDVGILSFGGSKLLAAGRGGALLTRNAEIRQRIRVQLRRGVQQWAALSEIQAAALLPQLAKLDERNARRAANVRRLLDLLKDVPGFRPFSNAIPESQSAFYKLGFQFDPAKFGISRDRFVSALRAEGVAFDNGFRAGHVGRSSDRYRKGSDLIEAEHAQHGAVVLHHPVLLGGEPEIDEVACAVRKIYANAERL